MVKDAPKTASREAKSPAGRTIDIWAVQCGKCTKWRKLASQEEFEEIRSKMTDEPFYCDRNPNVSCENPTDIEYDSTRTWAVDKPNLPKPPSGFTRRLVMRKDFSKIDVYYHAPGGKTLRSKSDVATYLEKNTQLMNVDASQFSFNSPKIVDETVPPGVKGKNASGVID